MPVAADGTRQTVSELCVFILDHLIHFIIAVLLVFVLWIPVTQQRHLLSWHAILGVIAFLFLMSETILLFSGNPWYLAISHRSKVLIHGIFLGTGTLLAVLSVFFEYYRKSTRKGHGHFDSFHGVFALLATICSIFAIIGGLAAANSERLKSSRWEVRPVLLKLVHNVLGQAAYMLGILSLCCAYYSYWMIRNTSPLQRVVLVFLTCFIAIWVLRQAVKSASNQFTDFRITNNN